ncbi:putative helicase MOV-10 isoform X2 [Amblyomma americanum]
MDCSVVSRKADFSCQMCGHWSALEDAHAHFKSQEHQEEHIKLCLWLNEGPLLRNKCHVSVHCLTTSQVHFSVSIRVKLLKHVEHKMRVQLSSDAENGVDLLHCFLLEPSNVMHLEDYGSSYDMEKHVHLSPGSVHDVGISCKAKREGVERTCLVFKFREDTPEKRSFVIVRFVEVACYEDASGSNIPKIQDPCEYSQPLCRRLPDAECIIPAGHAEREHQNDPSFGNVPAIFEKICLHGLKPWKNITPYEKESLHETEKLLTTPLSEKNYRQYYTALLNLEKAQLVTDVRSYDMIDVPIFKSKESKLYILEVPGAKEGRPSVIKRSRLFFSVMSSNAAPVTEYEAIVRKIKGSSVTVKLSEKFDEIYEEGSRFSVRFAPNLVPLKRMRFAVNTCREQQLRSFIFPSCAPPSKPAVSASNLTFFNKNVQGNPEQSKAVHDMLRGEHRPFPYLLFGPPGTGKTSTIVEALKQICTVVPSSRILVVSPSNSATDFLAEQLLDHLNPSQMFRLYSSAMHPDKISKKLHKYSNYTEHEEEVQEDLPSLSSFKVIVTTLVTSAKLMKARLGVNRFTHIIVDEAGQALEPECIIPLVGLMSPWNPGCTGTGGHVILAGDPMQLGPVVSNQLSSSHGLGVSLLERLINMPAYQKNGQQSSHMMTKLLRNFRSHGDLLHVPNEMFYNSELQAYADEATSKSMLLWEELPTKGVPLLFHGVSGRDMQDGTCPSFFNLEEIKVVLGYVTSLLNWRNGIPRRVNEEDIGIISPYRKQAAKIQNELEKRGHKKISVGSTEQLQGQERMVIIATTVRSTVGQTSKDPRHRLGFLKNPKRFNVSVTRAKALMVIVGNPRVLCQDPCWNKMIEFCVSKGAYRGMKFEPSNPR